MAVMAFMETHAVRVPPSKDFRAFATVSATGDLLGAVALNNWWGRVCTAHIASVGGHWGNRELIWRTFDFVFRYADRRAIIAPVQASNERALKVNKKLGFKEASRVPDGWADGDDLIFMQLLREDCRWLERLNKRFAH